MPIITRPELFGDIDPFTRNKTLHAFNLTADGTILDPKIDPKVRAEMIAYEVIETLAAIKRPLAERLFAASKEFYKADQEYYVGAFYIGVGLSHVALRKQYGAALIKRIKAADGDLIPNIETSRPELTYANVGDEVLHAPRIPNSRKQLRDTVDTASWVVVDRGLNAAVRVGGGTYNSIFDQLVINFPSEDHTKIGRQEDFDRLMQFMSQGESLSEPQITGPTPGRI
jgi:hypothetical protein